MSTYPPASDNPVDFVRNNSYKILDIMRTHAGHYSVEAQHELEVIVEPVFDFQKMIALAVGPDWNRATTAQKEQLSGLFQKFFVRVYSKGILQLKDLEFQFNESPLMQDGGKRAIAKTIAALPNGQKSAKVDYVLIKLDKTWKVIDIRVEGGSLVTVYRDQFSQKIKKSGIDGLIAYLEEKT